jgi:hypothetical protein
MKKIIIFLCFIFCGCAAVFAETVPFETIKSEQYAPGIVEKTEAVVKDEADFSSLWEEVTRTLYPPPELPAIDFSREMVLFVSLGEKSTGGYTVAITEIIDRGDHWEVVVVTTEPGPDDFVTQGFTQPYHLVTVEKTDVPLRFRWKSGGNDTE